MTKYETTVDWPLIHEALSRVDVARNRMRNYGNNQGLYDHFGGTYCPASYEQDGLYGLVRIWRAVEELAHQCWDDVHSAHNRLGDVTRPRETDYLTVYRSVRCRGRGDMTHGTHRGAACRATRYSGEVERGQVLMTSGITARRMTVVAQTRAAVTTAATIHEALSLLSACGVCKYRPAQHICGVVDGRINLTGLGWLDGSAEKDGGFYLDRVDAVLSEIK